MVVASVMATEPHWQLAETLVEPPAWSQPYLAHCAMAYRAPVTPLGDRRQYLFVCVVCLIASVPQLHCSWVALRSVMPWLLAMEQAGLVSATPVPSALVPQNPP